MTVPADPPRRPEAGAIERRPGIEASAGRWRLRSETLTIPYRDPFLIARRHEARRATTVIVELRDAAGRVGWGEAYPDAYYGETPATIEAVLPLLLSTVAAMPAAPDTPEGARDWLAAAADAVAAVLGHHGAAKCALDVALHDLIGQRLGVRLVDLVDAPDRPRPTDFTLGLDEPAVVAERAARAARFPALKIKLGGPADVAILDAVRSVYAGPIRVDANTGWELGAALALVPELERRGVELIEQPFPAHRLDDLAALQAATALPVVADESAVVAEDLDRLVGVVAGVNVKLAKVGGVGPARRMIRRARELGFRVFLGCMEETSIVVAASAALAGLVDWVDLDGCLLLAEDPFTGLELGPDCRWRLPARPGLGVHPTFR